MTNSRANPALFKLLQIVSPSLPVGGYSYSQGLEWAVHTGWVTNRHEFDQWLREQLNGTMAQQDLPLLLRLYHSRRVDDRAAIEYWDAMALAVRETSELRREEIQRGKALFTLLQSLGMPSLGILSLGMLSLGLFFDPQCHRVSKSPS